jgi:tagatose-1,6-bisphosphate aldolase non-catalytic subunit AgaZ/GatZ
MILERLRAVTDARKTLLGVGPMSMNCINASIEISNEREIPILLIASRRQIDSEAFAGGYVNNWTTEQFADYVIENDKKGKILLCRDHGGPWQNQSEVAGNFSLRRAMDSAKESYRADIQSGFQVIHIDTSVDIHGTPSRQEVLDRCFELMEFCWSESQKLNKEIIFEIGTEEQSGSTNSKEELETTLRAVSQYCKKSKIPFPAFTVIQCGTRVMETRNVGSFDSPVRVLNEIPTEIQLPQMIDTCNQFGIMMKEHNTDYLSDDALKWHPRLGIHAANVAPEFGVTETRAIVELYEENGLQKEAEKLLAIAFDSKKWFKWMLKETVATDRDRAIIAGHYVFSNPDFIEVKEKASEILLKKGIDTDFVLKSKLKMSISRYLKNFRLIENQ